MITKRNIISNINVGIEKKENKINASKVILNTSIINILFVSFGRNIFFADR
jgi:hypothetical protein